MTTFVSCVKVSNPWLMKAAMVCEKPISNAWSLIKSRDWYKFWLDRSGSLWAEFLDQFSTGRAFLFHSVSSQIFFLSWKVVLPLLPPITWLIRHYKKNAKQWRIKFVTNCMFFLTNSIGDKTGDKTKGRHKKSPGDKISISSPIVIILWQKLFRHL